MRAVALLICIWIGGIGWGQAFVFSGTFEGWKGDFTDYPVGEEQFYELAWGWENLPLVANGTLDKGLYLSGNNHSDDLFMFVKYPIEGLKPITTYIIHFASVIIESNAPEGSVGIGGAPGESIYFKVGASTQEPQKVDTQGFYLLNVDKGDQSQGGANAVVLGNLASPSEGYQVKKLYGENAFAITTDAQGKLWIFVGTDSGFEGRTKFYIARIELEVLQ